MGPLIENLHEFGYSDTNLIAAPVRFKDIRLPTQCLIAYLRF